MRRLRTHLRSTCGQARFNHRVICHEHADRLDRVDIQDVVDEWRDSKGIAVRQKQAASRSTVERWAARFKSGDADVTDLHRSGRPVSATTSENIALIESIVMEDKCITVNQLEQSREISSGAIHTILTTELGYRSICGKWVPHKFRENQRLARLNIAKKLLETYENCDSRRLTEIITGDETWVYCTIQHHIASIRSDHA
ncbi:Transposase [Oopsacas minuta]|uniref:Transposase n=1 Tax=Oopsacas minuta TaxID=111878 RepID=A0AAV7K2F2_9METZ|nr:Transposase [Oopsacas minuta]